MSDDLDSLSDTALNDVLSALLPPPEHRWIESRYGPDECAHCGAAKWDDEKQCVIHWTWNVAEVLRLLEPHQWRGGKCDTGYFCELDLWMTVERAVAPTFTRAVVVALIRALRTEAKRLAQESETGAICGRCKGPMRPNVPWLGWTAGAVHAKSGLLTCPDQWPEQGGFVT